MDHNQLQSKVVSCIQKVLPDFLLPITSDTTFISDLQFDSMLYLSFIIELEKSCNIELNSEILVLDQDYTLQDFIKLLEKEV